MIRILWTFAVAPGHESEFVRVYGPEGDWDRLFRAGEGYRGTRLLRELGGSRRYLTEDSWESAEHFERFKAAHRLQYEALDARCHSLTADERLIGTFGDPA